MTQDVELKIRLAADRIARDSAAIASQLKRQLGGIKIGENLIDLSTADAQLGDFTAKILQAKAALSQDAGTSSQLQKEADLLRESLRLKQELANIDASGLSPQEAEAAKQLAIQLSNLNRQLINKKYSIEVDTDEARRSLGQLEDLLENLRQGFAQGIGQAAFGAIENAITELPGKIAQTTLQFEKFRTVLTTLLGSADAAEEALGGIQDFSNNTPFELDEVTNAYIKLKQRGLDPTNETLTRLGDIAASQGKELDQITEAILDATGGEFERLKEFGIQASSSGDQVALSFRGVNLEVAKTPEAIAQAILSFGDLEGVQGGMLALSKTLGGQLSTLSDVASSSANAFGQELLPVLLELVQGFNEGGGGAEEFARQLGAGTADLIQLLANALKLAADNATLLESVLQALLIRMVALKAIALFEVFKASAIGMELLAVASGKASVSLTLLKTQLIATAAAAAAALAPLAAFAALIGLTMLANTARKLSFANEELESLANTEQVVGNQSIALASRLKAAADAQAQARQNNVKVSDEEIAKQRQLLALGQEQLRALKANLEAVKTANPADDKQRQVQQNLIQAYETSIGALEGQVNALQGYLSASGQATSATTEQASAFEKLADSYEQSTAQLENAFKERQAAIAESGASEAESRNQTLAAERDYLTQSLQANRNYLAELKALRASTTDPKELDRINGDILKAEQALADDRLKIAENSAQQREEVERQALEAVDKANREAESRITQSQNARIAAVRQAQLEGVKTTEEAEAAIAQIQQDGIAETLNQRRTELAEIQKLRQAGTISLEEATQREADLSRQIGELNLQRIEAEIEATRRLAEERINAQFQPQIRGLQGQANGLDIQAGARQGELDLLNAQTSLQEALNNLEQERLNTRIATAEAAGNEQEVDRLRAEQQALQLTQLEAQFTAQQEQLKLQQEIRAIELDRELINTRIAALEAEVAVRQAQARGASALEIATLQQVLNLRQQQVGAAQAAIDRQAQMNSLQQRQLQTTQEISREQARQNQLRDQAQQQRDRLTGATPSPTQAAASGGGGAIGRGSAAIINRSEDFGQDTFARRLEGVFARLGINLINSRVIAEREQADQAFRNAIATGSGQDQQLNLLQAARSLEGNNQFSMRLQQAGLDNLATLASQLNQVSRQGGAASIAQTMTTAQAGNQDVVTKLSELIQVTQRGLSRPNLNVYPSLDNSTQIYEQLSQSEARSANL